MSYRLRPEEISQTSDERKRRPIENVLIMQGGGSLELLVVVSIKH
jgi:hypothetical protein